MIKHPSYNKTITLLVMIVFTLVNLSAVSNVFCSMKDTTDCCCKVKTEKKSCCAEKKEVKFTRHCVCEIKEAQTDPAELPQNKIVNIITKTLKIFTTSEISFSGNENVKIYSNSLISTFHSPPNEDINTLKCVLRI